MSNSADAFVPHRIERRSDAELLDRAEALFAEMDRRRSVRHFSDAAVPREVIEWAIRTASTAPSGAHRQPWRFVAVSDPALKTQIREAAEAEEYRSYEGGRMPDAWKKALEPLGTDWQKPYLETVPWLVVVFEEQYGLEPDGSRRKNYYVKESVGIACGMFIAALHQIGLTTLTHTPSPMGFLAKILERPENERPYMLFPVGFPADDAQVPALTRKPLEDVAVFHEAAPKR